MDKRAVNNLHSRVRKLQPYQLSSLEEQVSVGSENKQDRKIPKRSGTADAPLSYAQERLWFIDQIAPNSSVYNLGFILKFEHLNMPVLKRCIYEVMRRHESLRTTFRVKNGEPVQVVHTHVNPMIPFQDLTHLDLPIRMEQAEALFAQESARPMSLTEGPLFKTQVVRVNENESWLQCLIHHIVSDGRTIDILTNEITTLYQAYANFNQPDLPKLPIQYIDFSEWQREWLQGDVLNKQLDYWRKELRGAPELVSFPGSKTRPTKLGFDGESQFFHLSDETTESLRKLSGEEDGTMYMILLSAFKLLLHNYTSEKDVVVGSPVANRTRKELENMVGFFVNTLLIRTRLNPERTFRELLRNVKKKIVQAQDNQDVPFERLVDLMGVERSQSYNPLFQMMFSLENASSDGYSGGIAELNHQLNSSGRRAHSFVLDKVSQGTSKFDMTMLLNEDEDSIMGVCEYNTQVFDAETIRCFLDHYICMIEAAVAYPDLPCSQLTMYSSSELDFIESKVARSTTDSRGKEWREYLPKSKREAIQTPPSVFIADDAGDLLPLGVKGQLWMSIGEEFVPTKLQAIAEANGAINVLGAEDRYVKFRKRFISLDELEEQLIEIEGFDAIHIQAGRMLEVYVLTKTDKNEAAVQLAKLFNTRFQWLLNDTKYSISADKKQFKKTHVVKEKMPRLKQLNKVGEKRREPDSPVEIAVSGIWKDTLAAGDVGLQDNFFDLGGNSMNAFQVLNRIKTVFGISVEINKLFEFPTLETFAAHVSEEQLKEPDHNVEEYEAEEQKVEEDTSEYFPLSFGQEQMWFIYKLNPKSPAYNVPVVIPWNQGVNANVMKKALTALVERHGILRSKFTSVQGKPVQFIVDDVTIEMEEVILSEITENRSHWREIAQQHIQEDSKFGFDLENGSALRLMLFQFDSESWLYVNMHHILSDGASHTILISELRELYTAFLSGVNSSLPTLKKNYGSYALDQRKKLSGTRKKKLLSFWKEQLRGAAPLLQLKTKKVRPAVQSTIGERIHFVLPKDTYKRLHKFCKSNEVTAFMVLLSAFKVLLHAYSGQRDILVGSPVSNRFSPSYERLVGYFLNTVVLRSKIKAGSQFSDLLNDVKNCTIEAFKHQDLPVELLISELKPQRSLAYHPVFQVMFSHQELHAIQESSIDGDAEDSFVTGTSKFDLSLSMGETENEIQGALEYCSDLFDREFIDQMLEDFQQILATVVGAPNTEIEELKDNCKEHVDRSGEVTVNGVCLNPVEIEEALLQEEIVKEAYVVVEGKDKNQKLVAYVVSEEEGEVNPALPDYMRPSKVVQVKAILRDDKGKVFENQWTENDISKESKQQSVVPRTDIEVILVALWAEVLKVPTIGIRDNFFEKGGASLTAVQIVSRIRELYDVEVPIFEIFEHPTIEEMAGYLEQFVKEAQTKPIEDAVRIPELKAQPRKGSVPLSFAQERLWFLDQFEPGTAFYNVVTMTHFSEVLDVEILEKSLHLLIERHEPLRTVFEYRNDRPVQVVQDPWKIELEVDDLSQVSPDEREVGAFQISQNEFLRPFDLELGPLFRYKVIRKAEDEFTLLLTMHHIVSDAWSMNILENEIRQTYHALKSGGEPEQESFQVQYADFAIWQRKWMKGAKLDALVDYWREKLSGAEDLLELPFSKKRPQFQTYQGAGVQLEFPKNVLIKLRALAQEEGVTPFTMMLTVFNVLLFRYSNNSDVLVGTPIANRSRKEIEGLVGFFTNTLVIRNTFQPDMSFRELLHVVKQNVKEAHEHSELPFEKLVERIQPVRNTSYNPIFQIMFSYQNPELLKDEEEESATEDVIDVEHSVSKFDLTLHALERSEGMSLIAEYNVDLYENQSIRCMLRHFVNLASDVIDNMEIPISSLQILDAKEEDTIVREWNQTKTADALDECLHEIYENAADRNPEAIAVDYYGDQMSYWELEKMANRTADFLQSIGIRKGDKVAVCMNPSLELPIFILAVAKAGAIIVPLDKKYPIPRLQFMLDDSEAVHLVVDPETASSFPEWKGSVIVVDEAWKNELLEFPSDRLQTGVTADDEVYLLYTSGSTGKPKGAALMHKSVSNLVTWQLKASGNRQLRTIQFSPTSFDVSFQEIYSTWASGGTLFMIDIEDKSNPDTCLRFLHKNKIERLFLPFVALDQLANAIRVSSVVPVSLKQVITAGEQLRITPEISEWFRQMPDCRLENQYGPVETHIVTSYVLPENVDGWESLPPIGKPLANIRAYIVDENLNPVPMGVPGEVCIGGKQVATGYLNRPEITQVRFVDDPFNPEKGAKMYRTGDKALFRPDGNIEFIGRMDNQVKIRGFRVEPGEIEAAITTHNAVREAVVVFHGDSPATRKLVCYAILNAAEKQLPELKEYLSGLLPEYMVPSFYIALDELPKTPSGKIDRLNLSKRPLPSDSSNEEDLVKTPLESRLSKIWEAILGVKSIGIQDNFFDLGGHSLLVTKLIGRIADEFGVELSVKVIFESPTIRRQTQEIVNMKLIDFEEPEKLLVAIEKTSEEELFKG